MGDVTDRVAPRSRSAVNTGGRSTGFPSFSKNESVPDLKVVLSEVEPLPGSSTFSSREVDDIIQTTAKMVGDTNVDWLKRLNMLKTFRSLCADPTHHVVITSYLRHLMPPLQSAVKDPRSQVAREACATVAFIAAQLGVKADTFIEPMLSTIFTQLVANAKIVAITGVSTLNIIYEYVPSFRILPPLQVQMGSKSKEIRKSVASVLKIVLETWPIHTIQKHINVVNDVVKKGLTDADADTRLITREVFPVFQASFPAYAKTILDSLDPAQQRQIQIASANSTSSSIRTAPNPHKTVNSTGSLQRQTSLVKKSSIPILSSRLTPTKASPQGRSTSAIDLQAVSRAKQNNFSTLNSRTPLKNMGRTHSTLTSPVTPKYSISSSSSSHHASPTHLPLGETGTLDRSRNRTKSRLSHSQPGSRSNSPSSRFAYATYTSPYSQQVSEPRVLRKLSTPTSDSPSFIPGPGSVGRGLRRLSNSSNSSSRETSPQGRILTTTRSRERSISNSPQLPLSVVSANSATAKMLQASREAESMFALRDALRRCEITELNAAIKETKDQVLILCHMELLKILFSVLKSTKSSVTDKALAFQCLEELYYRNGLRDCLAEYTELFIVHVTEVQSIEGGGNQVIVTKAAESCALALAATFPPETVARAICPIVLNKDFPINQLAIKMLQRLFETSDSSKLRALLPDVMNALVCAYDHPDSAVRKSAVFAIVALYIKMGSELDPYLATLSGSKLKLLHLYIQRAQNNAS